MVQWTGVHLQVCTGTDWRQLDNQASPEITDVSPKMGPITGGTDIVVSGTFFAPGAVLQIDDKSATGVTVTPPNKITAKTPPGDSTGWMMVKVINPDGQEATLQNGFGYKPTVDSITPNVGSAQGGLPVTIKGAGFAAGAKVWIGPDEATNVQVADANTINCKTAKGSNSGTNDVKVKNVDGMEETKAAAFTYQPWIDFLSPDFDYIAGGKKVIANGAGFGTGVTLVQLVSTTPAMTINVSTYTKLSATQVELTIPNTTVTGYKDVKITSAGIVAVKTGGFHYIPSITGVNPAAVPFNDTATSIVVVGTGFNTSNTWVKFDNVTPTVSSRTTTSVTVKLPAGVPGTGWKDVTVTNNDSPTATSVTSAGAIQLTPKITGYSPVNGPVTGGTTVTISGAGFAAGPSLKVLMEGKEAGNPTVVNSTTITAVSPAVTTAGQKTLRVVNGDGTWFETASGFPFTPVVSSINPSTGFVGGGLDVTISGLGFAAGTPATTVSIGGGACTAISVVNDKTITCKTPTSATTGAKDIVVTVNGQVGTLAGAFAYVPSITNVNPASGSASGGYTITITGTGFVNGTTAGTQVLIGTVACASPTTTLTTKIVCTVPLSTTTGPRDVRVTNPDGMLYVLPAGFTYTPGITSVTQASTNALGGWDLTINGAGFAADAKVYFDNTNNDVTLSVKSRTADTQIVVTMPAGYPAGKHDLIVKNPADGTTITKTAAFTLDPTVTGVSQPSGPADQSVEVTITGAGFSSATAIPAGTTEIWIDGNSTYKCASLTVNSTTELKCTPPKHAALLAGPHTLVAKVVSASVTYTGLASANYSYNPAMIRWLVGGVEQNWGAVSGITATYTIEGWGWPTTGIYVLIDGKAVKSLTRTGAGSGSTTPQTLTCVPDSSPSGTGWKPVIARATNLGPVLDTLYPVPSPLPSPSPKQIFRYDPVASSFLPSPFEGPASGNTLVTINGSGLTGTVSVTFGGLPGTGTEGTGLTVTDTQVTVKSPGPFKAGPADVYVNKSDGSFIKLSSPFLFKPVVTSVVPAYGPADGSQVVTVTGAGFWTNATNPAVSTTIYVGTPGSSYTCGTITDMTLTWLKCTPQRHATGLLSGSKVISARVTVAGINYDSTVNGTYEYRPQITSWSANYAGITGATGYSVYGWGLASSAANNKVQIKRDDGTWKDVPCTGFYAGSGTGTSQYLSSCTIPAGDTTGWKAVRVTATIGSAYTTEYPVPASPAPPLVQNIRYDPVITTISPANGDATGGTLVTINGGGFQSPLDKIMVEFGAGGSWTEGTVSEVAADGTYIKVGTPGPLVYGAKDVRVTKALDGTTVTKASGFTYNLKITSVVNPADLLPDKKTIEAGGGEDITINGGGFDPNTNPTSLTVGGVACAVKTKAVDKIVCTTGSVTSVGPKDVYIRYGASCAGSPNYNCYTATGAVIVQPTLTQVWDFEGPKVGGENIKLTGQGFVATAPYATYNEIYFGSKVGTITSVTGTTTYQVTTPPGDTTGWVPIKIRVRTSSTGTWYESDSLAQGYKYRDIPSVTGVSPASGSANGGEWITVTGTGFVDGAQVQVGDDTSGKLWDCTDEVYDPVAGTVKAKTPAGVMEAGIWGIKVINPGDYSHWKAGIYTVHPAIAAVTPVSPAEGPASGGTAITVTGAGFTKGNTAGTTVQIGRLSPASLLTCTVTSIPSSTQLVCTTPASGSSHAAGPKDMKITVGTTTPAQANGVFTYKPVISTWSKATEIVDGGTSNITVTGAGFATTASIGNGTTTVKIDGVALIGSSTGSTTSHTGKVPPSTSGTGKKVVSVTATVAGVDYTTTYTVNDPQAFTYLPKITAIKNTVAPNVGLAKGSAVGSELVNVDGGGFKDGASIYFTSVNNPVKIAMVTADSVAADGKSLQAKTPEGLVAANYNVTVTNSDNTTTPAPVAFQFLPTLLSVTPTQGPADGSATVTVDGAGFASAATSPSGTTFMYIDSTSYSCGTVTLDGATPTTKLACKPQTSTALMGGKHALMVQTRVPSTATAVAGIANVWYDYLPTITTWAKNYASISGATGYSLTGTGFKTGVGNTRLSIEDASVDPLTITITSATSLTAITIPTGTSTGWKDVTVKVPAQCFYTVDCVTTYMANQSNPPAQTFRYDPTVAGISPTFGPASGGTVVTVTGTFFAQAATVSFGGIPGTDVAVAGDGKTLTVKTPAGHIAGAKSVVVTNPDGSTVTSGTNFTFNPIVLSMDLTSGPADGSQTVLFTGAGFASSTTSPTGTTTIKVNNVACGSVSQPAGSSTTFTCKPTSSTSVGPKDVVSSAVVSATTYTEVAPFKQYTYYPGITAISPNSGHAKGAAGPTPNTTAITAWGMTNPGTTVKIGGQNAEQSSYSASSPPVITVKIPESTTSGWKDVSVTVSGQTGTKTSYFKYTPYVSAVLNNATGVASGVVTGGDAITITGQGFEPGITSVKIDGNPATGVLVVGSTQVLATTPAATSIGKKDILVTVTKGGEDFSYTFAKTVANAFALTPVITGVNPQYLRPGTGIKTDVVISGAGFSTTATYNQVFLVLGGTSVAQTVKTSPAPQFNQIVVTMDGTSQAVGFRDLKVQVRDSDGVYQPFNLPRGIGFSNNGTTSALPALNCMAAKTVATVPPASGRFFMDPDGAGAILPFEVFCEMIANGGGLTLVAKAATTSHAALRGAAAANLNTNESDGIPAVAFDCAGPDQKLGDDVIKLMWGGKDPPLAGRLMMTVQNGPATALSKTDISAMATFSDRCGTKNGPDWLVGTISFPANAGTDDSWDCGWSAFWVQDDGTGQPGPGPFVVLTRDGWVSYVSDAGGCQNNDCGCGYGWLR